MFKKEVMGSDWGMTVEMCKWMDLGQILETEASLDSSLLMEQKWRESQVSPLGLGWTAGHKMTTFRETGQAGVEKTAQGPRGKPGAQPSCAAAAAVHEPLELAWKDGTVENVVSASVSARPSQPAPCWCLLLFLLAKILNGGGDQGLGAYPLFLFYPHSLPVFGCKCDLYADDSQM